MKSNKRSSLQRRVSFDIRRMALEVFEEINTPISLGLYIRLRDDIDSFVDFDGVNPLHYLNHTDYAKDYFASRFLSKYDGFQSSRCPKQVAREGFKKAEAQCAATNQRLKREAPSGAVSEILHFAREKIFSLIGDVNGQVIENILDLSGFGPGVSSSCKGDFTGIFEKHASVHDITPELYSVLSPILYREGVPRFLQEKIFCIKPGNTITTVPKNSKSDRMIAVEPHINMFLQKGTGAFLRSKLRRWGVNLNDQTKNQQLSEKGSLDGSLSTIDLSMASDTIAIEAVRCLLPPLWVSLLESMRSSHYFDDGQWHRYSKHSSMGNGYTFELESLLFSAIVAGTYQALSLRGTWSVYGDDIIIATEAFPRLKEALDFLGFTINTKKSFTTSPFRESCGADFFNGVDVTPFYFKKSNDVVQIITFANWLRSDKSRLVFKSIIKIWKLLYFSVPKEWANKGSSLSTFICFHVNEWEFDPEYVLVRRPYGPWIGYRTFGALYVGFSRQVADSSATRWASIAKISSMSNSSDEEQTLSSRLSPMTYVRESPGRRRGKWVRRGEVVSTFPLVRS